MPMQPHLFKLLRRVGLRGAWLSLAAALPVAAQPLQPPRPPHVPDAAASRPASAPAAAPLKLRVVGGLGAVTQYTRLEGPFWSRDLARLSGGRYSADIVPFDRAGVPGMEMLRLLQLGVVPLGTTLMSSLSAQYPQYTAADLPGLNPSMAVLRSSVAASRPYLEKVLREEHDIELLAVYTYPAQVLFCKRTMAKLADLAGRRIRVASAAQADFVAAVGGVPVLTSFGQMRSSLESGETDCAVTGAMSGNILGLHTVASYLYPMPLTWGLALFGANRAAWAGMPADLRRLLRAELPKLEAAIWASAEQETSEGIACNTGAPGCHTGSPGRMTLVPVSAEDDERRQALLRTTVLTRWLRRCTARCADIWSATIGPVQGIAPPPQP